ncbi:hypothetical protein [Winogradskyella luteola]|uniref:Uncharacterized protein n=1 Tax=Winogradskyella luteola TaxID=2828330 RepID=A0A9X1F6P0_9FLAO|nr:hypothetical protein [Winogradskyella luteola]MBV7268365.1 hypothetical protein [Winogradskyella luteola]
MILQKQSLLDISIQEFGSLNELIELSLANEISITEALVPGTELQIPKIESSAKDIQQYYKSRDKRPATALSAIDYVLTLFEAGLFENGLFE